MVDFKKHVAKSDLASPIDPIALYETLDRASDKGPLREAQAEVLRKWHGAHRNDKDVIVKLHTGQGKTLIGLLILQSKLNETASPAVYLCPNNFLVQQTATQAAQFGLKFVRVDRDLPAEFLDGQAILITSVQKLFNGLTKFGLGGSSVDLGALVMDDSHACIDAIKEACRIRLASKTQPYNDLLNLFGSELESQGVGTFADIRNGKWDAFLPVPYWAWGERKSEVAGILAKAGRMNEVKFAWPLLKDSLQECLCVISGTELEIVPYLPPLHLFGSFAKAPHRVFMSATVTNDSFLVKGLGLSEEAIREPLHYEKESWSGEKMILIPSLIDGTLDRETLVSRFAKRVPKRTFGVVVLAPSTRGCQDWSKYGAVIADGSTIVDEVEKLIKGDRENVVVIVNRYDGIDLPDGACRILFMDSKPYSEDLADRYVEACRANSATIATKTARIIEQGLGRSVRGEKDYCVFLLLGASLIKALRSGRDRAFFSSQTRTQIEIGLKIAELAKEEIKAGGDAFSALTMLINQCLQRDSGWKEFYTERMNEVVSKAEEPKMLDVFTAELEAERSYQNGHVSQAVAKLQKIIDKYIGDDNHERGWYLQEMARFVYSESKTESNKLQVAAHQQNRYLMRPEHGMTVQKLTLVTQKRLENIIEWVSQFASFEELYLGIDAILDDLQFGVKAERFESSLDKLAFALGFLGQRPDKEWKEGPDNLWAVRNDQYVLIECKNEVDLRRAEINKDETGQMNNATAWFKRHYVGVKVKNLMIISTKTVGHAAGFNDPVEIVRNSSLKRLSKNVESFYREFKDCDLLNLSEAKISEWVGMHHLTIDEIMDSYSEKPKQL
jgi:replicative superfamily II helicase